METITWDIVAVWTIFGMAVLFLLKPLLPTFQKKKRNAPKHSDCNKCQ